MNCIHCTYKFSLNIFQRIPLISAKARVVQTLCLVEYTELHYFIFSPYSYFIFPVFISPEFYQIFSIYLP